MNSAMTLMTSMRSPQILWTKVNLQFGFLTGPTVLACMTRLSITLLTALIALLASLCLKKSLSSEMICLFLYMAKAC